MPCLYSRKWRLSFSFLLRFNDFFHMLILAHSIYNLSNWGHPNMDLFSKSGYLYLRKLTHYRENYWLICPGLVLNIIISESFSSAKQRLITLKLFASFWISFSWQTVIWFCKFSYHSNLHYYVQFVLLLELSSRKPKPCMYEK